jgi:hypothetical protein
MSGWIEIDWKSPPTGEVLLYFPAEGTIRGRPGQPKLAAWITVDHCGLAFRKPTHWMPLPEPPK